MASAMSSLLEISKCTKSDKKKPQSAFIKVGEPQIVAIGPCNTWALSDLLKRNFSSDQYLIEMGNTDYRIWAPRKLTTVSLQVQKTLLGIN